MKNPGVNPKSESKILLAIFLVFFGLVVFGSGFVSASDDVSSYGESHGAKGWVATDTYRVINFAILAAGLFFIVRKPVAQALNSRINGIKQQLAELEEKKQAAEKELVGYTEKLASLEKEAAKIIEEYVRQGDEAKARILKEAEASAAKLEEKARRNIDHEFMQAKLQLQAEIIEKALIRAEKKIMDKITPDDQDKLVDEYIEKVVA